LRCAKILSKIYTSKGDFYSNDGGDDDDIINVKFNITFLP